MDGEVEEEGGEVRSVWCMYQRGVETHQAGVGRTLRDVNEVEGEKGDIASESEYNHIVGVTLYTHRGIYTYTHRRRDIHLNLQTHQLIDYVPIMLAHTCGLCMQVYV